MDDADKATATMERQDEGAIAHGVEQARAAAEESRQPAEAPAAPVDHITDADQRIAKALELDALLAKKDIELVDQDAVISQAKERRKALELEREEIVQELREAVRGASPQQPTLPFGEVPAGAPAGETSAPAPQEDESWRQVKMSDEFFGLKPSTVTALAENEILTLGDWADKSGGEGSRRPEFKGIGDAKRQEIDDAVERFWAERLKTASDAAVNRAVVTEPDPGTIYKPADLGLVAGAVSEACHNGLILGSSGGKRPKLRGAVTIAGTRHVVIGAREDSESVYELRPLLAVPNDEVTPDPSDPHFGIVVTMDKEELLVGPEAHRVLVDDRA